ncbi:hypothetical protein AHiyo8_pI66910 (plasmid) [Arthrobacter sp. Hiyo8]|nr:hypothetical protein AHiyo8_pI66910 [Arthrobacter sp. Hiyo8]
MNRFAWASRRAFSFVAVPLVGALVGALIQGMPAEALPSAKNTQSSNPLAVATAEDFGPSASSSSDEALAGFGDASGYHVQLGRESGGFAWKSLAVIKPQGVDASSWTGYQCLSGDGNMPRWLSWPLPR